MLVILTLCERQKAVFSLAPRQIFSRIICYSQLNILSAFKAIVMTFCAGQQISQSQVLPWAKNIIGETLGQTHKPAGVQNSSEIPHCTIRIKKIIPILQGDKSVSEFRSDQHPMGSLKKGWRMMSSKQFNWIFSFFSPHEFQWLLKRPENWGLWNVEFFLKAKTLKRASSSGAAERRANDK